MNKKYKDTLCWSCKYATGGCSWALDGTPVEGWTATKTYMVSDRYDSYIVHKCPQYKFDKIELSPTEVCKLLNVGVHQYYRLGTAELIKRLTALGYSAKSTIDSKIIIKSSDYKDDLEVNIL